MPQQNEAQKMKNYSKSQSMKELEKETPERDESASERLQRTKEQLEAMKIALRGMKETERWDEDKGAYVTELNRDQDVAPLISKEGLEWIWNVIEPTVSETAAGSNLSEKDVAMEGFDSIKSVIGNLIVKHDEWNVQSTEAADLIVSACNAAMKNNLKKAEGGRLLDHHEESRNVKEFISHETGNSGSSWNPFS